MKHTPGSPEAVELGCTCPRIDNGHGLGCWGTWDGPAPERAFIIDMACPVHVATIATKDESL
jgi:hypothetical protein